jgi:hypothetical protein
MIYQSLNKLWQVYNLTRTKEAESDLLQLVTRFVKFRYRRVENAFDDIAQNTMLRVWRTLPTYTGNDPLTQHDPSQGDFAQWVTIKAIEERKMFHRGSKYINVDTDILEKLQHNRGLRYENPQDPLSFEVPVEK